MSVATLPLARLHIDGRWLDDDERPTREVISPWDGAAVGRYQLASAEDVAAAVAAARVALDRPLTPTRRWEILDQAARLIAERREPLARLIVAEAAKPIRDARAEVDRAVLSFRLCAEESKRLAGEAIPFEGAAGHEHRIGQTLVVPVGVVAAITPFNAPINQLTHKVPAAFAAGCPVVFKPSELTPGCATAVVQILVEAGIEPGWVNLVHGSAEVGAQLVADDRVAAISFTGSVAAGKAIRAAAGLRPAILELGNSSPNLVHLDADLDLAAGAIAKGGFSYAGQLCISVQRVLVHADVYDDFVARLVERVGSLVGGDPSDEATDVGPMISEAAAIRAEQRVQAAVKAGATLGCGGQRDGSLLQPTVLLGPSPRDPAVCEEMFAPVIAVLPYRDLDEAVALANSTPYGLAAGVFTNSIDVAYFLGRAIEVGTVNVNDVSTARADLAPFAGIKDSGAGREGIRYAMREFTHERLVAFALHPASVTSAPSNRRVGP
jgi:acyl-CoA reductase-like NAD-dependent aldehyde dehydrogenase